MTARPTLVWFRQDLRLRDHAALQAGLARGAPVIPLYLHDPAGAGNEAPGAASRWWLHHSLRALFEDVTARGGRLITRAGPAATVLEELLRSTKAAALYWNRCYEPAAVARDADLEQRFTRAGLEVRSFQGALLHEPRAVMNRQGRPFRVFTPYWRHCLAQPVEPPLAGPPAHWPAPEKWPEATEIEQLDLLPGHERAAGYDAAWTPGEAGAQATLRRFLHGPIDRYDEARERPAEPGTSRLSPHLHFGEISPRQVWAAVRALGRESGLFPSSNGARVFLTELGWREFAYHQLFHFPDTPEQPLRKEFGDFPWRPDPGDRLLQAWQRGRTGFPIVDAGMRELWATGWMHNRVRMIAASFLVKHLRLPWMAGARWFWETLVDADLANNTLGWQWSAGCGADAAPYFRIFNPMTQGGRYDAAAEYVHRWVPELGRLPRKYAQAPWTARAEILAKAGVELGRTYPHPIVDHAIARREALEAFAQLRARKGTHA